MSYIDVWNKPKNPTMAGDNPHFKSKFATLVDCEKSAREMCKDSALRVSPVFRDGVQLMVATFISDSGEQEIASCQMTLPSDPQKVGSAITYYRRYVLCAALGIVGDKDDDANDASDAIKKQELITQITDYKADKEIPAEDFTKALAARGMNGNLDFNSLADLTKLLTAMKAKYNG